MGPGNGGYVSPIYIRGFEVIFLGGLIILAGGLVDLQGHGKARRFGYIILFFSRGEQVSFYHIN
jgi:hypothetical protein